MARYSSWLLRPYFSINFLKLYDYCVPLFSQVSQNYIFSIKISGAFLVYFIGIMITKVLKQKFSALALQVEPFLEYIIKIDVPAARRVIEIMKKA